MNILIPANPFIRNILSFRILSTLIPHKAKKQHLLPNVSKLNLRISRLYFDLLTLKSGDIFVNDFINHQVWKNNKLIFKSKSSPLQNLLNKFAHSIEFEDYKSGMKEIYNSYETIKVIEKFI